MLEWKPGSINRENPLLSVLECYQVRSQPICEWPLFSKKVHFVLKGYDQLIQFYKLCELYVHLLDEHTKKRRKREIISCETNSSCLSE